MVCEHCGAPLRADRDLGAYVCDYCESTFPPPPGDDGVLAIGQVSQKCPLCSQPLWDGSLETFSVLLCRACSGVLLAMDDLMPLVESLRARRDAPVRLILPRGNADGDRHLTCPKCGKPMNAYPYGGAGNVNIDSCEDCGVVWLDRGELRRIASAPDETHLYLEHGEPDRPES
jgi:Zn-finger nucleic acid-binding protein